MAIKINENWKEELIQNIKDCGQSLIDNAESIANDYEHYNYRTDLTITCYVNERDRSPYINISTEFIPENWIERYK